MTVLFSPELAGALLNELFITMPFHLFAYAPFRQHLRLGRRKMPLFLISVELAYMMLFSFLYSMRLPLELIRLSTFFIYGIPFLLIVDMEWGKISFLFVFTADYVILTHAAASCLEQYISKTPKGIHSWQTGLLGLLIFLLTLPFMLRYFCKTAQNVFEIEAPGIWNKVWLLPVFNSVIVYLCTFSFNPDPQDITFLLPPVFLMGSIFLIYYYVIQSIRQFQQQLEDQEKIRYLEQLAGIQANEYKLLKSHIEETRRARHDLRQHLRAIQGYIDKQDFLSLKKYLRDVDESIPLEILHVWSGNPAVDAILGFYAQKALSSGIDMKIAVHMNADTIIPEHEFCVLLGNLLENALEACTADSSKKPVVQVHIRQTGHSMLTLTVDNTCSVPPSLDCDALPSSKHPGSGIGTGSARAIAERYHGDARFEWKNGVFYASVMLNP